MYSIMDTYGLDSYISNNLLVDEKRKKDLGEVMTPPALIDQMLDTFPPHVFSNPDLTWLEPTCGSGHFMICVFKRLMSGLTSVDASIRRTHIIRNMLFMVDINKSNVDKCRSIFGSDANIICSNILCFSGSFDIIVGNVPFQSISLAGGKSKLYEKVVSHCLTNLLSDGGWMSLIVPDNLFSGGSKTYKQLIQHNVVRLNVCKSNQQYFPKIQQFICYFLLEKIVGAIGITNIVGATTDIVTTVGTTLVCNNGDLLFVSLLDRPINPIRDWNVDTEQLANRYISPSRNQAVYVRGLPVSSYIGSQYKIIYTPSKWLANDIAVGIGIKKVVIFSISIHLEFMIDWDGEWGVGPNTFYIPIESVEDGMRWKQFLESPEYRTLAVACRTCRQFLKNAFVSHLICV